MIGDLKPKACESLETILLFINLNNNKYHIKIIEYIL